MRTFLKVNFIILIFIIGSIIIEIMKEVGIHGVIPKMAIYSGMVAAMRAIWRYNPKKTGDLANGSKLNKES